MKKGVRFVWIVGVTALLLAALVGCAPAKSEDGKL